MKTNSKPFIWVRSSSVTRASYLLPLAAVAVFGGMSLLPAQRLAADVTATVPEDNGTTSNASDAASTEDGNQDIYTGHSAVLTSGYTFSNYQSLTQISFFSLTLTVIDGDSATAAAEGSTVNDFDFNHLTLILGGVEVMQADGTPFHINGLLGGALQSTVTFSNIAVDGPTGTALKAALFLGNGTLTAAIGTDNANDSAQSANEVYVGNMPTNNDEASDAEGTSLPGDATTTLTLGAVPEPGAARLLAGFGGLLLLGRWVRARGVQKLG